ncbi:alpha-L-arabinofuranosidase C-terminal domain-containing protein [Pedobacter africanus]|uniref:non-reducing end alpha-L-arabinofuranosidase n=1 Tax=Pedobacter africanus TaxID=151894 RepID=A0A1W1Z749_9SPHI|nr:alpha-L-arabinofuranosidase C-terminal domain-containing protein [Pedobacter africanus]SMC43951.1 Alpha-L-arabinofuranosidase [Pedobacter africanus]
MKRLLLILLLALPFFTKAQNYIVNLNKVKAKIQPTMWGLFFEDINRGADGGLYAELVKNRSFDFPDAFMGWKTVPSRQSYGRNEVFQIINQATVNADNPKYLQVTVTKPENVLLQNEGFGGVTVKKGLGYKVGLRVRQHIEGLKVKVEIVNSKGSVVGSAVQEVSRDARNDAGFKLLEGTITPTDTTVNGRLVLRFEGTGKMDIDRVSLMPTDTWKGSAQNMRADLVQKLADIKPGFMRFPGGCIVEGDDLTTRYQWKKTIGPLEQRKLISNQWKDGGASGRAMPDYFQSYGLGFMEYFQLCADMKCEPMPILNCGLSCQFGAGEVVAADEMDEYVQDAMDLIEFANGAVSTAWGKRRAELGHPEPFNMKLLGIGNENWGPQYVERLELFTKAIKARYPNIQLITSTGYTPNPQFKYMDSVLRKMKVDIIDEHYYQTPNWFLMNAGKYDSYDRKGPKIFIGEYACHSIRIGNPGNKNTMLCALAEAAWMTGLERNADVVTMAAYAPLFAHVNDWQWTPNLIWFDNVSSYATPSYYVQQLFADNAGTEVLPLTVNGESIAGQDSVWASAAVDRKAGELILKMVNPSGTTKLKVIEAAGLKAAAKGTMTVLKGDLNAVNSIEMPELVKPVTSAFVAKGKKLEVKLEPHSFTVLRLKMK